MNIEYIASISEAEYRMFRIVMTTELPDDYQMWLRVRERGKLTALTERGVSVTEIEVSLMHDSRRNPGISESCIDRPVELIDNFCGSILWRHDSGPTGSLEAGYKFGQGRNIRQYLYACGAGHSQRAVRDHEFRHVRLNQPHAAHVTPSWYGDSVGHYEGDTLVIDTVGVKTDRPLATLDFFGTPYSQALHVVERYRLLDYEAAQEGLEREAKENPPIPNTTMQLDPDYRGKYLQFVFTVEDQGVFTMPWSAARTYGRPSGEWVEDVCAEGTPNTHYSPRKEAVFPTADKPDF